MNKKHLYFGISIWCLIWVFTATQKESDFKITDFNYPIWLVVIWMVGMWTAINSLLCKNRHKGGVKHKKKFFIAYNRIVDNLKIKSEIKKQNKQALKVLILWMIFLIFEGIFYYFNIIDEKTIILGTICLRIFDKLFILVWCPFSIIMRNRCCVTCRIFGWDQLMLNSTLIVLPSLLSYSLILLSIIYFIDWELAVKNHPERFLQISNITIRCSNCSEVCRRKRNKEA